MAEMPKAGTMQTGIVVSDLEAMTPFYRDGLGLAHHSDLDVGFGTMRLFSCGDALLKIMQLNEPPGGTNPPGGIFGGARGLRWVTFTIDDIETVIARCEQHGGTVAHPVTTLPNGTLVAMIEDPEANCWVELVERPAST